MTEFDAFHWAFLTAGIALAALHLYLGLVAGFVPDERSSQFATIGVLLFAVLVVYLTPLWRPVLYLVLVMFATYLGTLWVLGGMKFFRYGIVAGIVATGFIVLGIFLFLRNEPAIVRSG